MRYWVLGNLVDFLTQWQIIKTSMKNNFVTFEIAKKLKDKGYPQKFRSSWECYGPCYFIDGTFYDSGAVCEVDELFTAPTYYELFEWLRKKRGIYAEIRVFPTFSTKNKVHFCYTIKTESDGAYMRETESEYTYSEYRDAEVECAEYILDNIL